MKSRFNRAITTHPWVTIVLFTLVTAGFAVALTRLEIDTDVEALFPQDAPERIYKVWVDEYFGIDEPAVLMVVTDGPDGVFTPGGLALIKYLSDRMMELPAIDGDDLVSLSEIDNIIGADDSLLVDRFFEEPPATEAEARAIRDAVLSNPMMVGTVVSEDGAATLVLGEALDGVDKEQLYDDLRAIVAAAPVGAARVLVAGRPLVEGEMGALARADIALMFPIVIAFASVVLWLSLRCVRGVMLPLLVVVASVLWALGLMSLTGGIFHALSSTMVIILIPIGIADGIHVIDRFLYRAEAEPSRSVPDLVFETMQEMCLPVVLTSLTTAAGLASLAISEIGSVRTLGLYSGFGVLAAMVFSLTVIPASLSVLQLPRRLRVAAAGTPESGVSTVRLSERFLGAVATFVSRRPALAIGCGVAIAAFGVAGAPAVVVDASLIANFSRDTPVRMADEAQVDHFGGSYPAEIVVDAGSNDAWKNPENLRALEHFQEELEASRFFGESRSIVDFIKRMNAVMNPEDPDAFRIPDDQLLIAQYLLLYSMSGEPDDFEDVVDYDYRMANVRALVVSDHSPTLTKAFDLIDDRAGAILAPLGLKTHGSGNARISHMFVDLIVEGQARSLVLALVLVVLIAATLFRSIIAGILVALPVAIATVLNFGMLGWLGEPLGVTTALMSSIAIGIGVDYSIHFVAAYRNVRLTGAEPEEAMIVTLSTVGRGILYNAAVVIAGFTVLVMSNFTPNRVLGYLVSLSVLVCLATTMTTLAALIHRLQPAFIVRHMGHKATKSNPGSVEKR